MAHARGYREGVRNEKERTKEQLEAARTALTEIALWRGGHASAIARNALASFPANVPLAGASTPSADDFPPDEGHSSSATNPTYSCKATLTDLNTGEVDELDVTFRPVPDPASEPESWRAGLWRQRS